MFHYINKRIFSNTCLQLSNVTDLFCSTVLRNCHDLYKSGERKNGVYTIVSDDSEVTDVFCDQTTAGGGWLVFQKRLDGSVDFYRG